MKTSIFENEQAEQAFRHWQERYSACLTTNWTVSTEKTREVSFDRFCLMRYTGRLNFNLRENKN